MAGGISLMGLGGASFLVGLVLLPFSGDGLIGNPALRKPAVGLMIAGGATAVAGIPLTVWGGGRRKRADATLTLGPGQADLVVRF